MAVDEPYQLEERLRAPRVGRTAAYKLALEQRAQPVSERQKEQLALVHGEVVVGPGLPRPYERDVARQSVFVARSPHAVLFGRHDGVQPHRLHHRAEHVAYGFGLVYDYAHRQAGRLPVRLEVSPVGYEHGLPGARRMPTA